MRKKVQIVLSVVCMAALFGGCTTTKEPAKKPIVNQGESVEAEEDPRQGNLDALNPTAYRDVSGINLEPGSYISIIGKNSGSEFWKEVEAGVAKAGEDLNKVLGYKGEEKIKVNFSGPAKGENVEEQINILDEELARNPVALGIAIIDSSASEVQFDLAAENGTPIVAFDSGSDYKGIQAMCSANNKEIGTTAAIKLAGIIGDTGKVAVFVHDSASTSGKLREAAFLEELKEGYPGITAPVIYHLDDYNEVAKEIAKERNAKKAEGEEEITPEEITQTEVIQYILEKNPDITGCFATNVDASQELLKAVDVMKKEIPVVAVDGGTEQMKALEEGKISGLIVQNPYGMGYAVVISAARAALGMGNEAFVDTGFIWVTKENMKDKNISKMLY